MVEKKSSLLQRCVSAEIRARLAASRSSGLELAQNIGKSQNYVAKRLRDEAPFTIDDIEKIVTYFDPHSDYQAFFKAAIENQSHTATVLRFPATTLQENQREADAILEEHRYAASTLKDTETDPAPAPEGEESQDTHYED